MTAPHALTAIDLFAGWGGFSLGAEAAGVNVLWAANHWQLAVDAHALNHPKAAHMCQDLNQANFYDTPDHDILLAAPACQGHSQASQPRRRVYHDDLRATAFAVVSACDAKMPRAFIVENVPDFLRWRLYPTWEMALKLLGYRMETHMLTASRYGVPQRRKRMFIVGMLDETPNLDLTPSATEPAIGPYLDIESGLYKPLSGATAKVQERVNNARLKNGHGEIFLTQHVTNHPGVALSEPIRTITTGDQWAIVRGNEYRPLTIRENARAMGFPDDYSWPEGSTRKAQIRGLGNAVCPPVATALCNAVSAQLGA